MDHGEIKNEFNLISCIYSMYINILLQHKYAKNYFNWVAGADWPLGRGGQCSLDPLWKFNIGLMRGLYRGPRQSGTLHLQWYCLVNILAPVRPYRVLHNLFNQIINQTFWFQLIFNRVRWQLDWINKFFCMQWTYQLHLKYTAAVDAQNRSLL